MARCRQPRSPLAERDAAADRFRRGQLMHALLQHLPALPADGAARRRRVRFLDRPGHGLPGGEAARIADEVLAVLAHPDLAPLFGPDSRAEVPLTGRGRRTRWSAGWWTGWRCCRTGCWWPTTRPTARRRPRRPDTPVLYLRQMAAYRAVLRAIFPDRPVRVRAGLDAGGAGDAILPDALLDRACPRACGPDARA